jgi:SAM-dependent methyltransferase
LRFTMSASARPNQGKQHPIVQAGLDATGRDLASQSTVLSFLAEMRKLRSVVDFGCGRAQWLHAARRLGAKTILGYDNSALTLEDRGLKEEEFVAADLCHPVDAGRKFDLAVCMEVGQLIPADSAANLLHTLCASADWVLFAAALPHQSAAPNVNDNWLEYWAQLFTNNGYECYDILRRVFWHDTRIAYYYRQNTCLYVRPGAHYALKARGHEPSSCPPSVVHPETFLAALSTAHAAPSGLEADVASFYRSAGQPAGAGPAEEGAP